MANRLFEFQNNLLWLILFFTDFCFLNWFLNSKRNMKSYVSFLLQFWNWNHLCSMNICLLILFPNFKISRYFTNIFCAYVHTRTYINKYLPIIATICALTTGNLLLERKCILFHRQISVLLFIMFYFRTYLLAKYI